MKLLDLMMWLFSLIFFNKLIIKCVVEFKRFVKILEDHGN
jgi:hypothetical protein